MLEKKFIENKMNYQKDVSLKEYTTLHIGGNAEFVVFPTCVEEIITCIQLCQECHIPYCVVGKGSNLLALDTGYSGVIIVLNKNYSKIEIIDSTHICVESGATLKELCQFCLEHTLTGLEFACGIPGTVGGAICMNAGAYGGEMKDVVESVTYLDENLIVQTISGEDLDFSYRHSYFSENHGIILSVQYCLRSGIYENIQQRMDELMEKRRNNQPMDAYSAGSTFKRPHGNYASALIKSCDLQGFAVGDAEVSKKHAGFLINKGRASSQDFLTLMHEVQKRVYEETGYKLESEVQILGHKEKTL